MNLRKKKIISFFILSLIFSTLLFFRFNLSSAGAQLLDRQEGFGSDDGAITDVFPGLTGDDQDARTIVVIYIKYFLTFLGLIFTILIIWSGAKWMMSDGNEEEIKKARSRLFAAIIGMIIILSAYAITYYIAYFIEDSLNDVL